MALRPGTLLLTVGLLGLSTLALADGGPNGRGTGVGNIDADDIGGVVVGKRGGCDGAGAASGQARSCDDFAGVWVIAETDDLATRFRKIVVTDEHGRFVIPDLPAGAIYKVWARGYGLRDSAPVEASPGTVLVLRAERAASPEEAARIYPPNHWYSLIRPPAPGEFPGTGPTGNGISTAMRSQAAWVSQMKLGCQLCHQMGNRPTQLVDHLEGHSSPAGAFDDHVRSGQRGAQMSGALSAFGRARGLAMFGDWAARIDVGEVPPAPPRPQGIERNVVLTMWEWGDEVSYVHDEVATDKRDPRLNANGPVYGVEFGNDRLLITDPVAHTSTEVRIPLLDDPATVPTFFPQAVTLRPSDRWGTAVIWTNRANPHNPMIDASGRVWITTRIRGFDNPDFCKSGSSHPSAARFPINTSGRQLGYYDPRTREFVLIDTCYSTHHLQFAEDADDTLWLSGDSDVIGWFNTRIFDEIGDAEAAQGWCPVIVDTNGDGVIGEYANEDDPDPTRDTRFRAFNYGIIPNRLDGSVWTAQLSRFPGRIVRLDPGSNPPATCRSEVYEPPSIENPNVPPQTTGHGPRGIDVDRARGLIWTALGGSGHLAQFDRSRCGTLAGPTATGQHCPEGWTLHRTPGPQMQGVSDPGSADFHYYNWVDQFDTFGLGANVPIVTGSGSDSLLALRPDTGEWVVLRVPYPMGFYSRGLDGRIDDPDAGWKGRGLWADFGTNVAWHIEGGKSAIVRFQLRPHPLAR